MAAGTELFQYGLDLAQDRLDNARDDITTALMHAEVEDENGAHKLTTAVSRGLTLRATTDCAAVMM